MTRNLANLGSALGVALFCALTASAQPPKELEPNVVAAWQKVRADVGWFGPNETGAWEFSKVKPKEHALPAFRVLNVKPGLIAKLPAPAAPFALDLRAAGS